jgi:hypothetical protein
MSSLKVAIEEQFQLCLEFLSPIVEVLRKLGTNVTWHDADCQQHDDILKMKSIFNYQMPYPNIEEMHDLLHSKSKPLCSTNIWTNDINNEINDPRPTIPIINIINIEHHNI